MKNKKFLTAFATITAALGTTEAISNVVADRVYDANTIDVEAQKNKAKVSGFTVKKNEYKETLSYHSSHASHRSHASHYSGYGW
ncbi:hypothetical protein N9J50_01240 [Methylophilaceae bacterium]|nr:hypothetical protein [Methylophilaceae bacterium]